ncbi:hypothetical protein BDQ17DRAFT_1437789 [Cyathus striatus]|nr:hypothetical protein BDQ17DRAFT_1437789 [Cyathus striatus]
MFVPCTTTGAFPFCIRKDGPRADGAFDVDDVSFTVTHDVSKSEGGAYVVEKLLNGSTQDVNNDTPTRTATRAAVLADVIQRFYAA